MPADSPDSAFFRTLDQINKLKLQYMAWNDQLPNGTTSSAKAHSKGVLALNQNSDTGFYFGHSIPLFPNFVENIVIPVIGSGQKVYAQHAFCISLNGIIIQDFMNRILPIRPFIYSSNLQMRSEQKLS